MRRILPDDDVRNLRFDSKPSFANQPGQNLMFGSVSRDILGPAGNALDYRRNDNRFPNPVEANERNSRTVMRARNHVRSSTSYDRVKLGDGGSKTVVAPPPGFLSNSKDVRNMEPGYGRRTSDVNGDKGKGNSGQLHNKNDRLSNQLDFPGLPAGSSIHSPSTFDIEESMKQLQAENGEDSKSGAEKKADNDGSEMDDLENQVDSLGIEDESGEKKNKKKHHRDKVIYFAFLDFECKCY